MVGREGCVPLNIIAAVDEVLLRLQAERVARKVSNLSVRVEEVRSLVFLRPKVRNMRKKMVYRVLLYVDASLMAPSAPGVRYKEQNVKRAIDALRSLMRGQRVF